MNSTFKVAIAYAKPALQSELEEILGATWVSLKEAPQATVVLIVPEPDAVPTLLTPGVARLAIVPLVRAAEFTDALILGQLHGILDPSEVRTGLMNACRRAWAHFLQQQANEATSRTKAHVSDKLPYRPKPVVGALKGGIAATRLSDKTILLVDADQQSSSILKSTLVAGGHEVVMANTPDSALAKARMHKPILIVVHVGAWLPSPQSLLEILKHDADTRQTSVLLLSEDNSENLQHLCAHVLSLPIQPATFQDECERLIKEGAGGNKVLVVDDDPAIAAICAEVLRHAGLAVRIAANGEAALTEARTFRPDLILLDVMMPKLDGFQTATKLKTEAGTAMTPIIFLSALGETSEKVKAFHLGAEDYIQKPFVTAELVARVRKALARSDRELSASPTTQLPGSGAIETEVSARLDDPNAAFCYLDLDNLKAYNDYYGYAKADGIIRQTGNLIRDVIAHVGTPNDFIGHIAGDDFVFVTTLARVDDVCSRLCSAFDQLIPMYYDKTDRDLGFIETMDRYNTMRRFPLMTVSVAAITTNTQNISTYTELSAAAAVGKQRAKAIQGSSYVRDGISIP